MSETEQIVQGEVNKVFIAFCVAFNNVLAKNVTEPRDVLELAKYVQECLRKENYIEKNSMCKGVYSHQDIEGAKEVESVAGHQQEDLLNCPQTIVSEDCVDDWLKNSFKLQESTSKTIIETPKCENSTPEEPLEPVPANFGSNLQFIENILTIGDEIDRKSTQFPTTLHEVCFDEAEHTSQNVLSKTVSAIRTNNLSDDSGIFSQQNSSNIKTVPTAVGNKGVVSKNINPFTEDSLVSILEDIKTKIDTTDVFKYWKGSQLERTCRLILKCSQQDVAYEVPVRNFIQDLLIDIWRDGKLAQLIKWNQKIGIVKQLLKTIPVCLEVLILTRDILESITPAVEKGSVTSVMISKVTLFLDLIPIAARNLNALKPFNRDTSYQSGNVAELWRERFALVETIGEDQDVIQMIKMDIIPKLDLLLTSVTNKDPLMYLLAKQAKDELYNLVSKSHKSQDPLDNFY